MKTLDYELEGSGGLFGGGGSSDSDDNTLRSKATVKIVDLLGEGEIKGLVDEARSIFLDRTPLIGSGGEENFKGLVWTTRYGLPDQTHISGFSAVEGEISVSTEVLVGTPVTRTISEPDLDAIKVTVRIPALYETDEETGALHTTSVTFRIEVKRNGGSWTNPLGDITIDGKCTSPYDVQKRIALPKAPSGASHPWDVRVTRITPNSTEDELQNDIFFLSYTTVLDSKFSYPNSALVAIAIDGEQFGQSVPNRRYEVYGRIIKVPVNYDPETRVYTGIWNGTFKEAYCNCPAWVFFDIVTNDRFGLGEYLDFSQVDKWSLYEIAQYCDQMVDDGYGGTEPRFTFNGVLSTQQEAYDALQAIATCFRGMSYWSSGSVMASQDRPRDPDILANPSNVIDGKFEYTSSALKARHTVAVVQYADPGDRYERAYEPVYNKPGILRYGYREVPVTAPGCTSRGQAHRFGEWKLLTELNETQLVTYRAGMDHAGVRPGDIVAVQDPSVAMVELGGRLSNNGLPGSPNTTTKAYLDTPVTFAAGKSYTFSVVLPNGEVEERNITVGALGVPTSYITLSTALSSVPVYGAIFIISVSDLKPQQFKVVAIREVEPHIFEVSGVQNEPTKFAAIDGWGTFDPLPVVGEPALEPPTDLAVKENRSVQDGKPKTSLLISWKQPQGWAAPVGYSVSADTPEGRVNFGVVKSISLSMFDVSPGLYKFYVSSINIKGKVSRPATVEYTTVGWTAVSAPTVSSLVLVKGSSATVFIGNDVNIKWTNNFNGKPMEPGGVNPFYAHNTVQVWDTVTNTMLREERVYEPLYSYTIDKNKVDNKAAGRNYPSRSIRFEVSVDDIYARTSAEAVLTVSNPAPPTLAVTPIPGTYTSVLQWTEPTDADYQGVLVYVSTTNGFDYTLVTPLDVKAGFVTLQTLPGTTYYFRVGAYDTFGKTGLNLTAQASFPALSVSIDTTPPAVPTGLALSSVATQDENGNPLVTLTAIWNAVGDSDLAAYEIAIKETTGGNYISATTSLLRQEYRVKPNVSYTVKVLAFDKAGNKSAFCTEVVHTTAKDTTPPAQVTGVLATGSFRTNFVSWTPVTDKDLSHYEVYIHTAATPAPVSGTTTNIQTRATSYIHEGLSVGAPRWYWVRAVDTSGNKGAWSATTAQSTATTSSLDGTDITPLSIGIASFAANIVPPISMTSLPAPPFTSTTPKQVYLTTDKTIYVQKDDGTGWLKQSDASLIVGSIVAGQIAAGAIGTDQLAANAATIEKLSVTAKSIVNPVTGVGHPGDWGGHNAQGTGGSSAVTYFATDDGLSFLTNADEYITSKSFEVDANEIYRIDFEVRKTAATGRILMGLSASPTPFNSTAPTSGTGAMGTFEQWGTDRVQQADTSNFYFGATNTGNASPMAFTKVTVFLLGANRDPKEVPQHTLDEAIFIFSRSSMARMKPENKHAALRFIQSGNSGTNARLVVKNISIKRMGGGRIVADNFSVGSLEAYVANINTAFIKNANIISIEAGKITADSALLGSILVDGSAIGTLSGASSYTQNFDNQSGWATTVGSLVGAFPTEAAAVTGSKVLQATNAMLAIGDYIAFDPTLSYRIKYRVRRVGAAGSTPGSMYLGIRTYDASKLVVGANSGYVYIVANAIAQNTLTADAWVEYVGYFRGVQAANTLGARNDPGAPGKLIDTTRYFRPLVYFNFPNTAPQGNSVMQCDFVSVDQLTEEAAAMVNLGQTKIEPGMIRIGLTGTNDLTSLLEGPNMTEIKGGAISTNSIAANKLRIGMRNITVDGITFEHNSPALNRVSWTEGYINWMDDTNTAQRTYVAAGSTSTYSSGLWYIVWVKATGTLTVATSVGAAYGADNVILATYQGTTKLITDYGQTIIDGSNIKTGSITAVQANITSFSSQILVSNSITGNMLQANTIAASKVAITPSSAIISFDPGFQDARWGGPTNNGVAPSITTTAQVNALANKYLLWSSQARTVVYYSGGSLVSVPPDPTVDWAGGMAFPVSTLKNYQIEVIAQVVNTDNTFHGIWRFYNEDGVLITGSPLTAANWPSGGGSVNATSGNAYFPSAVPGTGGYVTYKMNIGPGYPTGPSIPAGAKWCVPGFIINDIGGTPGTTRVMRMQMSEMMDANLIVDGTIYANKLEIGSRTVTLEGIFFSPNTGTGGVTTVANRAGWSAGTLSYVADDGTTSTVSIAAGTTAVWTSGALYVYWIKGATSFAVTTAASTAINPDRVLIAVYKGGSDLTLQYGRTIIDGNSIKTNAITAAHINVANLEAISATLGNVVVNGSLIVNGSIITDKIGTGQMTSGDAVITNTFMNVTTTTEVTVQTAVINPVGDRLIVRASASIYSDPYTGVSAGYMRLYKGATAVATYELLTDDQPRSQFFLDYVDNSPSNATWTLKIATYTAGGFTSSQFGVANRTIWYLNTKR